ncbi:hypothetical protein [Streptomyces sp. NPDC048606]|uniref:hypothetical protein n=1 Tax=Streptomyces sp. NPDC048606 TaxID=3154726 RepID=UPI00342203B3
MSLRRAALAAAGAFTLLLAIPSSASAAVGEFSYTWIDDDGVAHHRKLVDPREEDCITLPETPDIEAAPAHTPVNRTDKTATVFFEADCSGEWVNLRPVNGAGNQNTLIRAVVFGG